MLKIRSYSPGTELLSTSRLPDNPARLRCTEKQHAHRLIHSPSAPSVYRAYNRLNPVLKPHTASFYCTSQSRYTEQDPCHLLKISRR